jgi:16S rRNA processing protein RimM
MASENQSNDYIVIGKIASPYGVKGWVRIFSFTEPRDNILQYQPLFIKQKNGWSKTAIIEGRIHGKTIVAHLDSVDDRDNAEQLKGREIAIQREQLPEARPGEYYWIDLIGCRVINQQGIELGIVDHLLETGANDVLVVRGARERLIPFVLKEFVKSVDLPNRQIHVDWDAEF